MDHAPVETLRADIHEAIAAGDATAVDRLFNAAGSPAEVARLLSSSSSEAVPSPLNLAAALWHLDIAERPLDDSADLPILNMTDEEGLSASSLPALHVAICCGHASVAELLIQRGGLQCVCTLAGPKAYTPLHQAAAIGHVRIARALLKAGADPSARAVDGAQPLHVAVAHGQAEAVKLLLSHGASVDAQDHQGLTALDIAPTASVASILLAAFNETTAAATTIQRAIKAAAADERWDVLAVLVQELGSRDAHALTGLFDELGPTACTQMAPAIVQAWLADVGTTEEQQAQIEEQQQELQEAHSGLQHLLVAAACALRGKDSSHQQQNKPSGQG